MQWSSGWRGSLTQSGQAGRYSSRRQELLSAVQRRIGGTGRVAGVQGRYIGSGKGYAAVRARAQTELNGYAAGYITNALENGHAARDGSRVAGKYMYRNTEPEALRLAEEGAKEIEKRALAYLEGEE